MKPLSRQKINILIDITMFLVMFVLVVVGILVRHTLIPGSARWEKYGQNVELTVWAMDRHQWGHVHLIVGIVLLALLILHLVFHWQQIVNMIKKLLPSTAIRFVTLGIITCICVLLTVSPIYIRPVVGDPISGKAQSPGQNNAANHNAGGQTLAYQSQRERTEKPEETSLEARIKAHEEEHSGKQRSLNIKGYHTIQDLSTTYHISADRLKSALDIPAAVSANERLGRIRRSYGFTMSDVERAVLELQNVK